MRALSVVTFLVVGILVAWLCRNSGLGGGMAFIVAFIPVLLAAWVVDKMTAARAKRP